MFQQAYYKLPPLVSASFSSHAILFPKKKSHRRLEGRFLWSPPAADSDGGKRRRLARRSRDGRRKKDSRPRHFPHHDRVADDEREKRRRPGNGIGEIERIEGRGGGEGRIQPDHAQQADAAQAGDGRQKGIADAAELADEGILHAEEDIERHVVAHADEAAGDDRRIGVEQREQRRAERVNQQAERQAADERGRKADEQNAANAGIFLRAHVLAGEGERRLRDGVGDGGGEALDAGGGGVARDGGRRRN